MRNDLEQVSVVLIHRPLPSPLEAIKTKRIILADQFCSVSSNYKYIHISSE